MTAQPLRIRASRRAAGGVASDGDIRVLVVDDHAAVRAGLSGLLEDREGVVVVAIAASAREALADAARVAPDVAVLDYQLGDGDGLSLCRDLKRLPRPPRVLVYTAYADGPLTAAAVAAGADAVLSKGTLGDELVRTIRALSHGRRAIPPIPRAVQRSLRARLEPRDEAILRMLSQGIPPAEVARALSMSQSRLESRRAAIVQAMTDLEPAGAPE